MTVRKLMRMLHGLEDFDLKYCGITTEILDALEAKPVVHGHWELLTWAFDYYRCSVCGFEQRLEEFPYCPNCGADMRGDNDG